MTRRPDPGSRRGAIHKQEPKALQWIVVVCAHVAAEARNDKGWRIYLRLPKRVGKGKAILAPARRVLTVVLALLTQGAEYRGRTIEPTRATCGRWCSALATHRRPRPASDSDQVSPETMEMRM